MSITLCKLIRDDFLKTNNVEFRKMIKKSKYYCTSCGRTARKKKFLCKPEQIKPNSN